MTPSAGSVERSRAPRSRNGSSAPASIRSSKPREKPAQSTITRRAAARAPPRAQRRGQQRGQRRQQAWRPPLGGASYDASEVTQTPARSEAISSGLPGTRTACRTRSAADPCGRPRRRGSTRPRPSRRRGDSGGTATHADPGGDDACARRARRRGCPGIGDPDAPVGVDERPRREVQSRRAPRGAGARVELPQAPVECVTEHPQRAGADRERPELDTVVLGRRAATGTG